MVEALTLVGVALLLAIPLGTLLSLPLLRFAEKTLGDFSIDYTYPWAMLPVLAIGGALLGVIASFIPARRAAHLEIDAALQFE